MLNHRENVDRTCVCSSFVHHQFDETDHLAFEERSEEDATTQERSRVPLGTFKSHPVMRESPALPDRTLVIYVTDSFEQIPIEWHFAEEHPTLGGLSCAIARVRSDLVCPPVIVRRDRQHSKVVPLHGISVFRRGLR